jgi:hypothetical protein
MFSKIVNFVKMTWMFFWRLSLFSTLFFRSEYNDKVIFTAVIIAAIMVFGFNKTFVVFPIFRAFGKQRVIVPADGSGEKHVPSSSRPRSPRLRTKPTKTIRSTSENGVIVDVAQLEYVSSATNKGRMTGFEPKHLEDMPVPHFPRMVGVPGEGLAEAVHFEADNIRLGQMGEENFAKALAKVNQLARFGTAWSIPVPDQERFITGPYNTDIDCVLATRDNIYLIDLKNYKSGDIRYYNMSNLLLAEDAATGNQVGEVKELSRNMEMATNAMKHHFPETNIIPVVVFMPTNKGEGFLDNVYWPGDIRAVNLSQFITELSFQKDFSYEAPTGGAFARIPNLIPSERFTKKKRKAAPKPAVDEDSVDWEDAE